MQHLDSYIDLKRRLVGGCHRKEKGRLGLGVMGSVFAASFGGGVDDAFPCAHGFSLVAQNSEIVPDGGNFFWT